MLPVPQVLANRQVPPDPHDLVQHLTSDGSLGQYPTCDVPPDDEQEVVVRQMPGVLPTVQALLIAAWAVPARAMARRTNLENIF